MTSSDISRAALTAKCLTICAALAGGEATLLSASLQANSRCIDRLALSAVHAAASRRSQDGAVAFWRREGLAWLLEAGDSA